MLDRTLPRTSVYTESVTLPQDLRPGLRSFPVGEYVVIYRIENEEVLILHMCAAN